MDVASRAFAVHQPNFSDSAGPERVVRRGRDCFFESTVKPRGEPAMGSPVLSGESLIDPGVARKEDWNPLAPQKGICVTSERDHLGDLAVHSAEVFTGVAKVASLTDLPPY